MVSAPSDPHSAKDPLALPLGLLYWPLKDCLAAESCQAQSLTPPLPSYLRMGPTFNWWGIYNDLVQNKSGSHSSLSAPCGVGSLSLGHSQLDFSAQNPFLSWPSRRWRPRKNMCFKCLLRVCFLGSPTCDNLVSDTQDTSFLWIYSKMLSETECMVVFIATIAS